MNCFTIFYSTFHLAGYKSFSVVRQRLLPLPELCAGVLLLGVNLDLLLRESHDNVHLGTHLAGQEGHLFRIGYEQVRIMREKIVLRSTHPLPVFPVPNRSFQDAEGLLQFQVSPGARGRGGRLCTGRGSRGSLCSVARTGGGRGGRGLVAAAAVGSHDVELARLVAAQERFLGVETTVK